MFTLHSDSYVPRETWTTKNRQWGVMGSVNEERGVKIKRENQWKQGDSDGQSIDLRGFGDGAADSRFPSRHHIFWSYNLPRCDDRSAAKRLSAVSRGDLVTCDAQMQKRQKYNLKVGAWWPMPFGGKCDSASASGSWEQNRTACRSTRNPIVTRRLQVSSFLQPENRPLLSTPVISVFKKRI